MTERKMKRKLLTALLVIGAFAAVFIVPARTQAAINPQINFQGKLTNPSDGTNVADGTYSIVFSIYSVPSGGVATWTETQGSVSVSAGIFRVALGSVTALPGSVDFNTTPLYLGIKVGADLEMTPRVQFTASPYAFNSDKLGGLSSSGYVQLSPSGQQTGNINVSGNLTAGGTYNGNTFTNSSLVFGAVASAGVQSASAQALNLTSGTTGALTVDSGTTGAVNVGTGANAKAITMGNTTSGTTISQKVGSGTTAFVIQDATDTLLAIDSNNNYIYIGGSSAVATPTLLVLGAKSATGDPTGTNGAMYYNSADGDYRAYQNGSWASIQPIRYVYLGADVTRAATTYADVTGMNFTVAANRNYELKCSIIYRSAATTTGIGIALNGPASPTLVAGQFTSNSTATALNGRSFNAYNGTGKTTGVTTANADTYGLFNAYFRNGTTAGTLTLRFAGETTTTVTIRAGTYCSLAEM